MAATTQQLESLAKARAARSANAAARSSPAPALAGTVLDSPDEVIAQLAEFANLMGDAVKKKAGTQKVLDQVANLLNGLDPAAYGEVLSHPVVEKLTGAVVRAKQADGSLRAGADLGQAIGKKPYTWDDVSETVMDWVEYTPRRTVPVTWNGLTYHFQEDVPVRVPKCFVDIEEESRRNSRSGREHIDFMFRKRDSVSDPTILADGTGRVRGMFTGGSSTVGKGLDIEVPDADRPGIDLAEEVPAEEGAPA